MTVHVMTRRDVAANWTLNNPILRMGEEGLEMDTQQYKVGDGITPWQLLPYWGGGGGGGPTRIKVKTEAASTYTLTAADEDYLILFTNALGCLVTGPAQDLLPIGFICHLHQEFSPSNDTVTVRFIPATGATTLTAIGLCTRAQYSSMSIIVQALNTYKIIGDVKVCAAEPG
jgi:hypothetical protein